MAKEAKCNIMDADFSYTRIIDKQREVMHLIARNYGSAKVDGVAVGVDDALDALSHCHLLVRERRAGCTALAVSSRWSVAEARMRDRAPSG